MNFPKHLRFINNFFSVSQLIKLTSQKLLLPFYHTVSNKRLAHICNLYTLRNTKLFEEDIDYMCKHFNPVSLNDLYNIISNNERISKPILHLSFDDGLSEIYTNVAPTLEKKGVPATFFINTSFVDNQALFYRYKVSIIIETYKKNKKHTNKIAELLNIDSTLDKDISTSLFGLTINDIFIIDSIANALNIDFNEYLQKEKPYMSTYQITELLNKGFTVGSHSIDHPFFKDITSEERKKQVIESFAFLNEKFNIQNRFFSFPFSDEGIGMDFFQWMYKHQRCNLSFGISGLKKDFCKYHLHRIPFEGTSKSAEDIIKSEYLYYIVKIFFNKNTYKRR